MTDMTTDIELCVPTLQSSDAKLSFEFYRKTLGFSKNWEHQFEPGFPLFISMSSGKTTVFITEHKDESAFGAELYLYVKNVDEVASVFKESNIELDVEPYDTDWGTREFNVRDPDGNKLRIGQSD